MSVDPKRVCFVGLGSSAVGWYRCYQPAMALDADHVGLHGDPPNVRWATGLVRDPKDPTAVPQSRLPRLADYEVVILQQPKGSGWLELIRQLQAMGVKVIYEIDDYIHGIRKQDDHDFRQHYGKKVMAEYELCMRVCDAMIVSTEYIGRRYRKFNRNVFVCKNGIDLRRYELSKPERPSVNIGWAGATGHRGAFTPWFADVREVMEARSDTCFVTLGQPFAEEFKPQFGSRALSVPFCAVEQYPAAMTMLDIALGPARPTLFYKGKSDLRWLEAGALGIPIIADPEVYPDIEHGVTGYHWSPTMYDDPDALTELLLQLVDEEDLRTHVGQNAKEYVTKHRSMKVAAERWREVIDVVASAPAGRL